MKSLLGVDQTMIKWIKVILYHSAARCVDRLVAIEPNHCYCRDIRPSSRRPVEPVWEFYVKLNHRGCPPSKVSTKPDNLRWRKGWNSSEVKACRRLLTLGRVYSA